jgi:hypothetical protein
MDARQEMDNTDFDQFVARQQTAAAEAAAINWDNERDEWLKHLDALYARIETFLTKYLSSGQIKREYVRLLLNEENIGPYHANKMVLRIGRQQVELVPVGTLLIGSKGRVDVVGPAGAAQLLLVDRRASGPGSLIHVRVGVAGNVPELPTSPREVEWEWRIVTRPPERRFIEITQQNFFQLIMEVANG